jgi:chitinase
MRHGLILFLLSILLTACAPTPAVPAAEVEMLAPEARFRVIGYTTAAIVVDSIQFDKLTHINYAFLIPNEDGTFASLPNAWKLEQLVSRAHQQGVKVLISVGGWGWDEQFEALAASPQHRATFVSELAAFVQQYSLDGADIDWEFPDPGQSAQNFLALMTKLRQALPEKLLTIAAVALGETGAGIPAEVFPLLDFVNIMAYDGSGENHSSMQYAQDALDYWLGRGLPPEKAVLGVPFYARPDGTPYYRLIQNDPAAANLDSFDYYGTLLYYNGIPTMQEKTALALERGSGIMIWTLEHDVTGELSLLAAIYRTVHGGE